mmetsp:Transcript_26922/g.53787  ORF Transcript_26922/g.53787 Transcript_26922/m.53787 type:complete len:143 (-) Transcript_26922:398-826(-)
MSKRLPVPPSEVLQRLRPSLLSSQSFDLHAESIRNSFLEYFELLSTLSYAPAFSDEALYPSTLIHRHVRTKIMDLKDAIRISMEELRSSETKIVYDYVHVTERAFRTIEKDSGEADWHGICTCAIACVDAAAAEVARTLRSR